MEWLITFYDNHRAVIGAIRESCDLEYKAYQTGMQYFGYLENSKGLIVDDMVVAPLYDEAIKFIRSYGLTKIEVRKKEKLPNACAIDDANIIAIGYLYLTDYMVFIKETEEYYDQKDKLLIQYIRECYSTSLPIIPLQTAP